MHFTRASHGGNVRETLRFETECVVATVRAGVYDALPADTTRTGEIPGLGIGLNIVRDAVNAHHGNIQIAPNPEGGTIFTLRLPNGL